VVGAATGPNMRAECRAVIPRERAGRASVGIDTFTAPWPAPCTDAGSRPGARIPTDDDPDASLSALAGQSAATTSSSPIVTRTMCDAPSSTSSITPPGQGTPSHSTWRAPVDTPSGFDTLIAYVLVPNR
jgi:hypothetical protein